MTVKAILSKNFRPHHVARNHATGPLPMPANAMDADAAVRTEAQTDIQTGPSVRVNHVRPFHALTLLMMARSAVQMTAMRAEMIAGRTDKINRAGDGPIPDLAVIDLPVTDLIAIGQQANHHGGHETEMNVQILVMIADRSAAPKDAMTAR